MRSTLDFTEVGIAFLRHRTDCRFGFDVNSMVKSHCRWANERLSDMRAMRQAALECYGSEGCGT